MRRDSARRSRLAFGTVAGAVILVSSLATAGVHAAPIENGADIIAVDHVLVSEVMTGGAGASDEFVELYNPGPVVRSLDGLELVYVTASGATVTRKALWGAGAGIPAWSHLLVANEAGIFAGLADVTFSGGLAATGGSMALRAVAATSAVDAVGWGTAASLWFEGSPAPAPPAGSSLERLPGGPQGSGQDADDNILDFVVRGAPDPQNALSAPVPTESPSAEPSMDPPLSAAPSLTPEAANATPEPTPDDTATPSPTETPTPTQSPSPTPAPPLMTIAEARAMPDGSEIRVAGITLTASNFHEGGGYLADATGGIAVLVTDGAFERGIALTVEGTVDDRYAQRTIRVDAADLAIGAPQVGPDPATVDTGAVGEPMESRLIGLTGVVQGSPTSLSAGLAFEVDDGSGPIRVLIGPGTGVQTAGWHAGATLFLTGVVGQRDSSGTGSEGYRVQPRDAGDVISLTPPATPEPTPAPTAAHTPPVSPSPTASPSPSPTSTGPALVTIAQARRAEVGAKLRIRGVVTLPSGLVEDGSAVVADASGAILIRTSSETGRLRRGQLVELTGTRSTKSGMLSLRVTQPAVVLGSQPEPSAVRRATGRIGEAMEAQVVVVRGLVRDGPRRTSGGGLSFTLHDGSGPIRVFVAAGTGITARHVPAGAWIELRAVVGQQTTGAQPSAGYRLWPRDRADVTVIARPRLTGSGSGSAATTGTIGASLAKPGASPLPSVILDPAEPRRQRGARAPRQAPCRRAATGGAHCSGHPGSARRQPRWGGRSPGARLAARHPAPDDGRGRAPDSGHPRGRTRR